MMYFSTMVVCMWVSVKWKSGRLTETLRVNSFIFTPSGQSYILSQALNLSSTWITEWTTILHAMNVTNKKHIPTPTPVLGARPTKTSHCSHVGTHETRAQKQYWLSDGCSWDQPYWSMQDTFLCLRGRNRANKPVEHKWYWGSSQADQQTGCHMVNIPASSFWSVPCLKLLGGML